MCVNVARPLLHCLPLRRVLDLNRSCGPVAFWRFATAGKPRQLLARPVMALCAPSPSAGCAGVSTWKSSHPWQNPQMSPQRSLTPAPPHLPL